MDGSGRPIFNIESGEDLLEFGIYAYLGLGVEGKVEVCNQGYW